MTEQTQSALILIEVTMDLLEHLITPSTAASEHSLHPASPPSGDNQSGNLCGSTTNQEPLLVIIGAGIGAPRDSHSPTVGKYWRGSNLASPTSDVGIQGGEINEGDSSLTTTPTISKTLESESRASDEEHSSECGPVNATTGRQATRRKNSICCFWYHGKICDRDPANPRKPGKPCPHLHTLGVGEEGAKMTNFAPGVGRLLHKEGPCGLELCRFKSSTLKTNDGRNREGGKSERMKAEVAKTALRTENGWDEMVNSIKTRKRKVDIRHRDDPVPMMAKRQKMEYDDELDASNVTEQEEETCFFWYHGRCSRSLGARNNYQCSHSHELTDPPTMVRPPPGFVHSKSCGLEWCPGDGGGSAKDSHKCLKTDIKGLGASLEPGSATTERVGVHEDGDEASGKQRSNKQSNKSLETCFFWYHGTCKRTQDAHRNFQCSMRHELENPPGMVQPPPGYVHKEPCGLEWCPGDAGPSADGSSSYSRNKPKRALPLLRDTGTSDAGKGGGEEYASDDRAEGERQDWYLNGFEDVE